MNSEILCKQFIECGFHEKEFKKIIKQVAKIDKNELLRDRIRENKLSKNFKQKPTVTYRKNKSLSDHLLKNDIANQQLHSNVTPCGKCKLCPQMNTAKLITNDKLNIT